MKQLLLIIFLSPFFVLAQSDSLPGYKIYSTLLKKEIGLSEMAEQLQHLDVVFFGEEHTDSITHVLQLMLFRELHQLKKDRIALSMEMFQTDVQLVLDEYLQGLITESNLAKEARLWKNYDDYRPLVEYAKENGISVLAANASSRYSNRAARNGLSSLNELSKPARRFLPPLPIDTLSGRYYQKFAEVMGNHQHIQGMYHAQSLWDATMAWSIYQLSKQKPRKLILHLNGRFHSDEKLGAYAHLQRYNSRLRCANISAFSESLNDHPDWEQWSRLADFVIITRPAQ